MSKVQRYTMEPTCTRSMATLAPQVALVKHPQGQVVLYADFERSEAHVKELRKLILEYRNALKRDHLFCKDNRTRFQKDNPNADDRCETCKKADGALADTRG